MKNFGEIVDVINKDVINFSPFTKLMAFSEENKHVIKFFRQN